jgi:sortase A
VRRGQLTGALGRILLCVGTLILLFVAYQLWGTAIAESHSQSVLRRELDHELHRAHVATAPTSTSTPTPGAPSTVHVAPTTAKPAEGMPVGLLQIPRIGVDKVIVEGISTTDLRQGPGQYGIPGEGPVTSLPGQAGNVGIAGHRTTYGAPFYNLDQLSPGDPIVITTTQGVFTYDVTRSLVVLPTDVSVMAPSATPELTLTACTPRFSASHRLVVQATLVRSALSAAATPTTPTTVPTSGGAPRPLTAGLAGGEGDWTPALWWGCAVIAAALAVWLFARRRRRGRWLVYGVGTVGVLVVLFFFFGAVSPLLPASF